jgi:hypothetical protein
MRTGLAVLAVFAAACAPPCERVCRKVLFDCELSSERVALDECIDSCSRQEDLYIAWNNDELQTLHREHRRCVVAASCEELADGACYEGYEELFPFDPDKELPAAPPAGGTGTGG